MTIPASDLNAMLTRIERDGGFTYNPRTQRFVTGTGYVVANPPGALAFSTRPGGPERSIIAERATLRNADLLARPGYYLGGWREGSETFVEVSQIFRSRAEALRVAADRGERAIYDLRNRRDIPVERVA